MSRNLVLRDDGLLGNLDTRPFGLPDRLLLQVVSLMRGPRNERAFIQLPTHGQATRDYSHFPLMVKTCDLGFADGAQATCDNSLMIVAGGLHAKGRLSFKTGVFDAVEPSKVPRRALWDKNENSTPRVRNEFMKLSQLLSPRPIKRDVVSFGGTRFGRRRKLGVTGMMRR